MTTRECSTCEGAGTVYRWEFACCDRCSGQEEWPCEECEGAGQVPTEEEINRRVELIDRMEKMRAEQRAKEESAK